MGYWTCWYEQLKSIAPKIVHHTTKHHTPLHRGIHHSHGLVTKKVAAGAGKLTLTKVCVYTGTLGALTGGIGAGIAKYRQNHSSDHSSPTDLGIPYNQDPGIPPSDYGYIPGGGSGYIPDIGHGIPSGDPLDGFIHNPIVIQPSGPDIPYLPNHNENVPEPASYLIFGMGVIVFIVVRYFTNKK
jgi:hypothetical protein